MRHRVCGTRSRVDYSREGRKGREWGIEKRKFHGDDTPLLGYGEGARMWESFFAANVAPFADLA